MTSLVPNAEPPARPPIARRLHRWFRRLVFSITSGRAAGLAAGMLVDRDPAAVDRAAAEIASSGDPRAIPFLLDAIRGNPDATGGLRAAFRGLGKPSVEPLLRLLAETEPRLREFAAGTLGDIGDPRATSPLAAVAESDTQCASLRQAAVVALSKIPSTEAKETVCRVAQTSEPSLRDTALFVLTVMRYPRAVEILSEPLRSGDRALRKSAAYRIARLYGWGDESALTVLLSALEDPEEEVRREVLDGIDKAAPRSLPLLARALRDACFTIRKDALEALRTAGWTPTNDQERALVLLSSHVGIDPAQPPDASIGSTMLDFAEDLARRGDERSRTRAAEALGWVRGDRAIDALIRLLADERVAVRLASIHALGRTGAPRALAEVAQSVSHAATEDVFVAAARILGATEDAHWNPLLAEAYTSIDPSPGDPRKWAAAEGLARLGDPRPTAWLFAVTADEEWAAEAVRLLELILRRSADRLDDESLESLATLAGVRQKTHPSGRWDEEDLRRSGLPESTEVSCDEVRRLAREAQTRRKEH